MTTMRRTAIAAVIGLASLSGPVVYQQLTSAPQLQSGQRLTVDQEVKGADQTVLRYQSDGNLVLYGPRGPLWASDTSAAGGRAEMQADGNLVLYDASGVPYWATNTHAPGAWAEISGSGLRLKVASTIWSTPEFVAVPVDPDDVPVSAFARRGRLQVANGVFSDDSGPVLPVYAHAGDLLATWVRDRARAIGQLNALATAGYQGVRVWATLGCDGGPCVTPGHYWYGRDVGPQITPGYWREVEAFGAALRARGMRAVWSQGDVAQLRTRQAYMTQLAQVDNDLGGFIDVLDCGNEAWQTGEPDARKLAECVGYYHAAGGQAIRTLTSPPGEGKEELDQYSIDPAQIYDVHSYRGGHSWDKRRHILSIPYEVKPRHKNGINSEGPGNGTLVSVTDNKHELDHEAMALLGVAALYSRQAYVWFSGEGVKLEHGLEGESGFASVPIAASWLHRDTMAFPRLHHGGASQGSVRFIGAIGEARADCRTADDGRASCTLDGPPGEHRFPILKTFEGRLCNPEALTCEPVRRAAGETLTVRFTRGRVLLRDK